MPTARPVPVVTATPSVAGTASPVDSSSPGASASATDVPLPLPHADATLEAKLPAELGGLPMVSYSVQLPLYMASTTGGDTVLYTPWLVSLGKTADQVTMAVATDPTRTENVIVEAFEVPGVQDAKMISAFGDAAIGKGWPVAQKSVGGKTCLEIQDPNPTGALSVGYAYAKGGILYVVVTDDPAVLIEAYIKLP